MGDIIVRVTDAAWKRSRKYAPRASNWRWSGTSVNQQLGFWMGVICPIVGGGGRQVRQRPGKSRASGSKSKGEELMDGWAIVLNHVSA